MNVLKDVLISANILIYNVSILLRVKNCAYYYQLLFAKHPRL